MWRALVFNWLIGNCDAHAKNFSLLYDARIPTLAPLYDLVSTTLYGELTTRLAMNLGSARRIEEVTPEAWEELAAQAGLSRRFATNATPPTIERVLDEAARLVEEPQHDNEAAREIVREIRARAAGRPTTRRAAGRPRTRR